MKNFSFLFLFSMLIISRSAAQSGFTSVTNITPVSIASNTGENPQSKVWNYAGKYWSVLATSAGTIIYRLDGNVWTNVLTLASGSTAKTDIKVVGNVTHIFVWKGTASYLYSVQYDPPTNKYKLWTVRNTRVAITLDNGVATGTIDIDGTGRMWLASDGTTDINMRFSDMPYANWSAPIQIATGTTGSDICGVVALPVAGKIGVFWSNKSTKRFGFKTHVDGADPLVWSADEVPASQSALNIGGGFADNQLNLKTMANGTLYSAVKTNYNTPGYPQIGLLIRHPDGTWDPLYPVTLNEGSKPIVIVNELLNKLKVVYTSGTAGIVYKESSASNISFGVPFTLITGPYDNSTSSKATYSSEAVILASNSTTAIGVVGTDNATILPTLTSVSIASNNTIASSLAKPGDIITLSFTASEAISTPVITIATHQVSATAGSGNTFTATYTMTPSDVAGTIPFTIDFSNTSGTAGAQVTTTTDGSRVNFDKTAPAVSGINRQSPMVTVTSASSVIFRTIYSEKVTGTDVTDFTAVVVSGTLTASVTGVTPAGTDGTSYDVTVSGISGNGTLRLDLNGSGTGIQDTTGNPIGAGYNTGQTYTIQQQAATGFTTIQNLTPLTVAATTGEKPQSKVWRTLDGKYWTVLPNATGTYIWRLDGTTWTSVLKISSTTSFKADCKVVNDTTHILLFMGATSSKLISVEYVPALNTYKLWSKRSSTVSLTLDTSVETATIDIDGTGRMWLVSDGSSTMNARWSDGPYSTWSAPVQIATGTTNDDICAVITLPGKMGIFWSNQNTKRFGFKTHIDGDSPATWSQDEVPASQSALNVGQGMADDHMNLKVSADGTLYCAVKTSYNTNGFTVIALLVRRVSGIWDNLYEVTKNGTRPIVLLNETINKIRVIYSSSETGGNILYKESPISSISFGSALTLMSGTSYNNSTCSKQTSTSEVVILATDGNLNTGGVLASDGSSPLIAAKIQSALSVSPKLASLPTVRPTTATDVNFKAVDRDMLVYPNPFTHNTALSFMVPEKGDYSVTLYNDMGAKMSTLRRGQTLPGKTQTICIDGSQLKAGIYMVQLITKKDMKSIKLVKNK